MTPTSDFRSTTSAPLASRTRPRIGLDIGGANIKASDGESISLSRPFPMWREPERLAETLRDVLSAFQQPAALAVTMTGELADCFSTKAEGVRHILAAVESAAGRAQLAVWATSGEFVSTGDACELVPLVAAANWHALATWAARSHPRGAALLIDVGSTTTDIIPLCDGVPVSQGRSDLQRLGASELVYTGLRRTPVCAVAQHAPWRGGRCPLAAEVFATMLDVYLILGDLPEDESDLVTANARPATREHARRRLARMLCADTTEISANDLVEIAASLAAAQLAQIATAIQAVLKRLPSPCELLVDSGEGGFLVGRIAESIHELRTAHRLALSDTLGIHHSEAACAYALARLAHERIRPSR